MPMQIVEMREAIRQALDEEMQRDPTVFIIGEEVAEYNGAYKITKGMLDKWGPLRVIDTPISELGFGGLAVGAAMTGLRPVVEFMSFNFSFVGCDQIISNAIKMYYMSGNRFPVPIVFRGPNGAAAQVSSQHSHCVEAIYGNLPGLIILSPSNPYDAKGLLKSAIRNNNPVLFLENELSYNDKMEIPTEEYLIPIGKAKVVREGKDVTLISHSRMVQLCGQAADQLSKKGSLLSSSISEQSNHSISPHLPSRSEKPIDVCSSKKGISFLEFVQRWAFRSWNIVLIISMLPLSASLKEKHRCLIPKR